MRASHFWSGSELTSLFMSFIRKVGVSSCSLGFRVVPCPQHSVVTGSEPVATAGKAVEGGGGCHCFLESSERPAEDVAACM